ncbi:cell division control protein 48 homolog C-like isoform X2 [Salvia miltiorrhiza]|uniref:cell division control protein 48 homolog C-like isoform X2 n=1 Tax=Salvia miltiorrhiza TaxID=226208 RepID=UPI0025AD2248|nr:cell division control protein 48 homolog C-like isoform X2 [Salvia miltiorrhiza]
MVRVKGDRPATLRAWEDATLRSHINSAAAGKINLTDARVVSLLRSAFPHIYSRRSTKLLIERVARISPLPCRRGDAVDNPTPSPVTSKRRKIGEARNVIGAIVVSSASVSASSSDSDVRELDQSENDEINDDDDAADADDGDGDDDGDDDTGETNEDVVNHEIVGDLGVRHELGSNRPIFEDLGGMRGLLEELKREVVMPLHQLKVLRHLGVEPRARILLHGPPGCGKTTLARAIANEAGVPFYEISAAELASGASGAPEENIRKLLSTAYMKAPSIVFIDEIDAMDSKTESLQRGVVPCAVNQLMACMDELYRPIKPINHDADSESSNSRRGYVLMIGATNMPDDLDPALRRRFDREIDLGVPDDYARRLDILLTITRDLKVEVDLAKLARCTVGFVGGDLVALVKEASRIAVNKIMDKRISEAYKKQRVGVRSKDCYKQPFSDEELENLSITMGHFMDALKVVQPSTKVEAFSTVPLAKWDDVGGLQFLKVEFERHVVKHIKFPEVYKTLIVEALANEAGANFLHIKAPELLKSGDEIGLLVRNIFSYARAHPPSIIFFDELDVVTPCDDEDKRHLSEFRQLMSEFISDTKVSMRGVYVIGATSRHMGWLKMVPHFSLIQTHFDRILYVPPPSPEERGAILEVLSRHKPIDANVDLMALGKGVACENFSGNDLSALMREAAKAAIDRPTLSGGGHGVPLTIKDADFKSALAKISPSLLSMQVKNWELLSMKFAVKGCSQVKSGTSGGTWKL